MVYFLIALCTSFIGAIIGIGGGVIMKPVLDSIGTEPTSVINLLSSFTVFMMSTVSIGMEVTKKKNAVSIQQVLFLALGSIVGGILGAQCFQYMSGAFTDPSIPKKIQAVILGILMVGCFLYTIKKDQIHTMHITSNITKFFIGVALGTLSSFLGIGGGPFNLIVLYYFFSFTVKEASFGSLVIVFFSQLSNILTALTSGRFLTVSTSLLLAMGLAGVVGGILGRTVHHKIDEKYTNALSLGMMVVILLLCVRNALQ